jgi:hypothetical protein
MHRGRDLTYVDPTSQSEPPSIDRARSEKDSAQTALNEVCAQEDQTDQGEKEVKNGPVSVMTIVAHWRVGSRIDVRRGEAAGRSFSSSSVCSRGCRSFSPTQSDEMSPSTGCTVAVSNNDTRRRRGNLTCYSLRS